MKSTILSADIPYQYALCFKSDCSKSYTCLRHLAALAYSADMEVCSIINPKHLKIANKDCGFYRPADKVNYAAGFIGILDQLTKKQLSEFTTFLINRYGQRTYYRMRKGERPLSGVEQREIVARLKLIGLKEVQPFDVNTQGYNW